MPLAAQRSRAKPQAAQFCAFASAAQPQVQSAARLCQQLSLPCKLRAIRDAHGFDPAIQGEVIGPGIQGNKYALKVHALRIFNLLNLDTAQLLGHGNMLRLLTENGLEAVPQLGTLVLNHSVDELVALAGFADKYRDLAAYLPERCVGSHVSNQLLPNAFSDDRLTAAAAFNPALDVASVHQQDSIWLEQAIEASQS